MTGNPFGYLEALEQAMKAAAFDSGARGPLTLLSITLNRCGSGDASKASIAASIVRRTREIVFAEAEMSLHGMPLMTAQALFQTGQR